MQSTEFTESLFRSIDTIVAERIKSLPYDITQLVEIVDDTNANAGIYTVTSNHQNKEVVYSDNPTYENGDKVYILNTADNKERRFILGLYQRNTTGRTDRVLSILDGSLNSLKQNLNEQMDNGFKGLEEATQDLDWKFGRTADGILSLIEDKEAGLKTAISQTAKEIRLEAESTYEGLNASLSITAREIRSEVHDFAAGLESIISETAGEIRQEVNDYYNNLFANLSITAGAIRSEVIDKTNQLESNITETAGEIRHEVKDLRNQLETSISQTAYEIRSEAHDLQHGLQSEISQTAERITSQVVDLDQGLSIVTQTATEIDSKVIDLQGNFSDISQTADMISSRVTNVENDYSLLEQTATQISSRVENMEGNFSEIVQTADQISSRVQSLEGNFSEIVQTADQISSKVESIEGNFSEIVQTADQIRSRVESVEGNYSEITQRADQITSRVSNIENGYSEISQRADIITSHVEDIEGNYSQISQTATEISSRVEDISGKYSELQQTVDGFDFTGRVRFIDLESNSETKINGDYIKTGTIDARDIGLYWGDDNFQGGGFTVAIGSTDGSDPTALTYGSMMYGYEDKKTINNIEYSLQERIDKLKTIKIIKKGEERYIAWENDEETALNYNNIKDYLPKNYFIATNAGVRMTSDNSSFYISGGAAHLLGNSIQVGGDGPSWTVSDRNKKNSISYDMSKYESFFNALKPSSYKFNTGTSNRLHTGYIYQDVEQALLHSNLTSQDFAGLVKEHDLNGEINCGLRYEEFIPLNTYMIQKTRKELEEKDNKIQQLENRIDELEQKLNLLLETLS